MQLNPKSMSSTTLLNVPQQKVRAKENISPSESLDAKKLKEFIRTHEEAEKALATQCVKTEAVCRLGQTLSQNVGKLLIKGFYEIKQSEEKERIEDLHKKISGYEFKWELFMTKCKLALVNNNNKISHLEDTLSFMLGKWFSDSYSLIFCLFKFETIILLKRDSPNIRISE